MIGRSVVGIRRSRKKLLSPDKGVRVAAIQFAPEFKKPKENLLKAGKLVIQAARGGAKLIVLPELMTTGYSFMSSEEAKPFSEVPGLLKQEDPGTLISLGWSLGLMARLAFKLDVKIVWGFVELDPGTGKLYNAQGFIEKNPSAPGDLYFEVCRKINRWGNDFLWAAGGENNPPVVHTTIDGVPWKVGLLICRDVRDKKNDTWTSFYEPGDADVVAFSANWGDGGFPSNSWMDFVEENRTSLIVSNRYGKESNNSFGEGGSCVIDVSGKVHINGLLWSQDCIVYADLKKGA